MSSKVCCFYKDFNLSILLKSQTIPKGVFSFYLMYFHHDLLFAGAVFIKSLNLCKVDVKFQSLI